MNIVANKGKILTNGKAYGKNVDLGVGDNADNWYEITEDEYKEILRKQEEQQEIM